MCVCVCVRVSVFVSVWVCVLRPAAIIKEKQHGFSTCEMTPESLFQPTSNLVISAATTTHRSYINHSNALSRVGSSWSVPHYKAVYCGDAWGTRHGAVRSVKTTSWCPPKAYCAITLPVPSITTPFLWRQICSVSLSITAAVVTVLLTAVSSFLFCCYLSVFWPEYLGVDLNIKLFCSEITHDISHNISSLQQQILLSTSI